MSLLPVLWLHFFEPFLAGFFFRRFGGGGVLSNALRLPRKSGGSFSFALGLLVIALHSQPAIAASWSISTGVNTRPLIRFVSFSRSHCHLRGRPRNFTSRRNRRF